jgi:site-specific recombinase XerD
MNDLLCLLKQNISKQLYLTSKTGKSDYVLCIHTNQLKGYGYCFAIIDLKARHIVSHFYKATPPNVSDMIDCLSRVIKETSFLPNVKFLNSSPASLFKNNMQYSGFISEHKINVNSATGPLNQIVQRTFRTLKNILRNQLQPNRNREDLKNDLLTDPLIQTQFDAHQISTALHEAIEIYNNKPHKALNGMAPNEMRKLLFPRPIESIHDNGDSLGLLPRDNQLKETCEISKYRLQVMEHYAGDWQQFFIDFQNDKNNKLSEILAQNKMLYKKNLELQNNLTFIEEEIAIMRKQRLETEQREQKRQNAKKQQLRDSITPDDFNSILALVKSPGFVPARKRAAFILLYYTGLRVSNLLNLFVNHIKDLLDKGKTYLSLNKGGASRHSISLSFIGRKRLNNHLTDFTQLMRDKGGNDPLFTTQNQLNKPISRSSFDNELNQVLKKASLALDKNIRTHSFRATIISELLETTPIHVVKDFMGHRDIKTTVQYNRNKITQQQFNDILNSLEETRARRGP